MKCRYAFTLIELLVVIAIIALLVSILMPSLQKAKELAKAVVCKADIKNVSYAVVLYAQESEDQLPYNVGPPPGGDPFDDDLSWSCRVGKIPEDQIPDKYSGVKGFGGPGSIEYEICQEGYADFNYYNRTEGTFKCPSCYDQVQNKIPMVYPDGDLGNGWGSNLSMNRGLSPSFNFNDMANHVAVKTTDVRGGAAMIGDGHLGLTGGVTGSFVADTYRYDAGDDQLFEFPADQGNFPERFGPWTHQPWNHAWSSSNLIEYYGHPGESFNLGLTDGSVHSKKEVDPADWGIN